MCQFESTQVFSHLGLTFGTKEKIISLPRDKVQATKVQAATVSLSPVGWGMMILLGLANFDSMSPHLARLYSHPLHFCLKGMYRTSADHFKQLRFMQETPEALICWNFLCHS